MFLKNYYLNSTAQTDLHLMTYEVKRAVQEAGNDEGLVIVLVPGGTAGVTLLEEGKEIHEAYRDWVEAQVPINEGTRPSRRSGSGPLYAHLRAAIVGSQLAIPVQSGKPQLGHWQEVVLLDFDDKIGRREVTIQVMGEGGKAQ